MRSLPRPAPGIGRWWVIGVLGCGLAVLLVVWVVLAGAAQRVTATTVAYQVLDDAQVQVTFDVTKPPALSVRCTVRAIDSRFTPVGSAEVDIAPAASATTRHTVVVRTTTKAVTGVVQDCMRLQSAG